MLSVVERQAALLIYEVKLIERLLVVDVCHYAALRCWPLQGTMHAVLSVNGSLKASREKLDIHGEVCNLCTRFRLWGVHQYMLWGVQQYKV